MSDRITKLNDLIRDRISEIFSRELSLKKGVFISVIKVTTTKDLESTKILVSIFPEKERSYAMNTLKKEIYRIQGALNSKMQIRRLPRIEFLLDRTQEEVDKLEAVFKQIKEEK
jgi:ribosome-binding factor A